MFLGFRICFVVLIPFIVLVNTVLEVYAIREELGPKSLEDLVASLPPCHYLPPVCHLHVWSVVPLSAQTNCHYSTGK